MIFKRKERKNAQVGTLCSIKSTVLDKMHETDYYKNNSISFIKEIEGGLIYPSDLRKTKNANNKVLIEDATLLYILEESLFTGVVKVFPLAIRKD